MQVGAVLVLEAGPLELRNGGVDIEQIRADSERDRWFTAEQAKDYGIIDNVIVKRGEML